MCIIVAKPKGITMPSMETLRTCWEGNPDGAGLMYADGKEVHIHKGFMTWKAFEKKLSALGNAYDLAELALVMHFRISTQAGVNAENTHPFPITGDIKLLAAKKSSSAIGALVHNGIIPITSKVQSPTEYSDTFLFVRDYVSRLVKKPEDLFDADTQALLELLAKSKLALLEPAGNILTIGKYVEEEGILYSNDTYLDIPYGYDLDRYWPEDFALYPCTEEMHFYDEELGDYEPCDPSCHLYDDLGELWFYDDEDAAAYPIHYEVFDEELLLVSAPKDEKNAIRFKQAA